MNLFDEKPKGAEFSPCGKYRYKLWRIWNPALPLAMCIGLNPSTASAEKNDQTISLLINVLRELGYGGFYMMNLFAWITPYPKELQSCPDPLGENDGKLKEVEALCKDVIVCWGTFKQASARIAQVLPMFPNAKCFGWNKDETPFHPRALVYIKGGIQNAQLFNYGK